MTREQAINYLISSGFTENQVSEIVRALTYESTTKNDLEVQKAIEIIKADSLASYSVNEILSARDLAVEALKQMPTTKNDLALIHTEGLDEEIRCTMCTNSMKSDRGCDGSCVVNKDMYKAVMNAIEKRIQPSVTPQEPRWIPVSERLPEKAFGCIVTVEVDNILTGEPVPTVLTYVVGYDGETWNNADGIPIPYEVIAWMPLPKPYREVEE